MDLYAFGNYWTTCPEKLCVWIPSHCLRAVKQQERKIEFLYLSPRADTPEHEENLTWTIISRFLTSFRRRILTQLWMKWLPECQKASERIKPRIFGLWSLGSKISGQSLWQMMDRQRWNLVKCIWFQELFLGKRKCDVMHELASISCIPKSQSWRSLDMSNQIQEVGRVPTKVTQWIQNGCGHTVSQQTNCPSWRKPVDHERYPEVSVRGTKSLASLDAFKGF